MKNFWTDFKAFALKGNVINLAVGVMIGAAFQSVVTALTTHIISPVLGIFGGGNFDQLVWHIAPFDLAIEYGAFLTAVVNFFIMALVIFIMVRLMNKLMDIGKKPEPEAAPATKTCPYCLTEIPLAATRCPACTSQLD